MRYDRAQSFLPTSMALWQFNKDLRDLNDFYWASRLSLDITARQHKAHSNLNGPELLAQLTTGSEAETHVGHTPEELSTRLRMADRWLRLTALVLASSAFERYLIAAVSAAVASDPLLVAGWPKRVDGLGLLKHKVVMPERNLEGTVKGEWHRRVASYKQLFRNAPRELTGSLPELEALRRIRNAVAHEFGSDVNPSLTPTTALLLSIRRHRRTGFRSVTISHNRLIAALRLLDKVANSIDQQLLKDHIGGYELAAIYLDWQENPARFEKDVGVVLRAGKKSHNERFTNVMGEFVQPFGKAYEKSMSAYLDTL